MSEDSIEDPILTTEHLPDDSPSDSLADGSAIDRSPHSTDAPPEAQPAAPIPEPSSPAQPSPPTQPSVPAQRWQIFPAQKSQAHHIAEATALSPLLAQVLINRGIYTPEQDWEFLDIHLTPVAAIEFMARDGRA